MLFLKLISSFAIQHTLKHMGKKDCFQYALEQNEKLY